VQHAQNGDQEGARPQGRLTLPNYIGVEYGYFKVQTIGQDRRNRLAGRDSFLGAWNISNLLGGHALESQPE